MHRLWFRIILILETETKLKILLICVCLCALLWTYQLMALSTLHVGMFVRLLYYVCRQSSSAKLDRQASETHALVRCSFAEIALLFYSNSINLPQPCVVRTCERRTLKLVRNLLCLCVCSLQHTNTRSFLNVCVCYCRLSTWHIVKRSQSVVRIVVYEFVICCVHTYTSLHVHVLIFLFSLNRCEITLAVRNAKRER